MVANRWWTAAAVLWTVFVWGGRIRNALADPDLSGATLVGVVALSLSFLVLAALVAVLAWRSRGDGAGRALSLAVGVTTVWTTAVWLVRMADIALAGDHEAAFVMVHVTLGVVSIGLWAVTWGTLREECSEQIPIVG